MGAMESQSFTLVPTAEILPSTTSPPHKPSPQLYTVQCWKSSIQVWSIIAWKNFCLPNDLLKGYYVLRWGKLYVKHYFPTHSMTKFRLPIHYMLNSYKVTASWSTHHKCLCLSAGIIETLQIFYWTFRNVGPLYKKQLVLVSDLHPGIVHFV